MRLAIQARCSTGEQHPDAQLAELRAYAQRRGTDAREFVDVASGHRATRPCLDALQAACRRREVDVATLSRALAAG